MRKTWLPLLITALAAITISQQASEAVPDKPTTKKGPIIVELFTSEGCSSCPPAERLVSKLHNKSQTDNQNVEFVVYHVDYWDYLGWQDKFGNKQFSDYQRQACRILRSRNLYTPQMIVHGRKHFNGSDETKANKSIAYNLKKKVKDQLTLKITKSESSVKIEYDCKASIKDAILRLCLTEFGLVTKPTRGENTGATLRHDGVVRSHQFIEMTAAKGSASLKLPANAKASQLRVVGYVQSKEDHVIRASYATKLN